MNRIDETVQPAPLASTALPGLSVVLTTRDRAPRLRKTLESYLKLEPPSVPWELVLVDNGSQDETRAVVQQFETRLPIHYLLEASPGHSRAKNAGIAAVAYPLVLFSDDDITVSPPWLTAYAEAACLHPEASYFGGPIALDLSECRVPFWAMDSTGRLYAEIASQLAQLDLSQVDAADWQFFGGNMAYRRALFERFGGFSTWLGHQGRRKLANEETVFQKKIRAAGAVPLYVPSAPVWHRIAQQDLRIRSRVRHAYWQGQGRAIQALIEATDTPLRPRRTLRYVHSALSLVRRRALSKGYPRVAMYGELARLAGYEVYMLRELLGGGRWRHPDESEPTRT